MLVTGTNSHCDWKSSYNFPVIKAKKYTMGWLIHAFSIGKSVEFFQRNSLTPSAIHDYCRCHTVRIENFQHPHTNISFISLPGELAVEHCHIDTTIII